MHITPAQVALACAASTLITGIDLVRTEHQQPAGSADRASVHAGVNQAWVETAVLTGSAAALAGLGHVSALHGVMSKVTPAVVMGAFAVGTAISVVGMHKDAQKEPQGSTARWLLESGAVGSTLETAGLVGLTIGMTHGVTGATKAAMLVGGAGLLAVGWPTSLGHGPISGAMRPGRELAPGPLPGDGHQPAAPKPPVYV